MLGGELIAAIRSHGEKRPITVPQQRAASTKQERQAMCPRLPGKQLVLDGGE